VDEIRAIIIISLEILKTKKRAHAQYDMYMGKYLEKD